MNMKFYLCINIIFFLICKLAFKRINNLDNKKVISYIKIIILHTELFAKKIIVAFIFEINGNIIYMEKI